MLPVQTVIAHQGGWDEIALFGIPVVVALLAVRLVERRAKRHSDAPVEGDEDEPADSVPEEPGTR